MKKLWTRASARDFGRILFKVIKKIKSLPDTRRLCQVEQELPFSVLCILMAMLTGQKTQLSKESWISANYADLCSLYCAFFGCLPESSGPISQSSISRTLRMISPEYLNKAVAKLGRTDFQEAWVEYSKYRIEIIKSSQKRSCLLELMQTLQHESIRVLAVDGKARKGVTGDKAKTEMDVTLYDTLAGQTLQRLTIPEKKGESTVFYEFANTQEFKDIVNSFANTSVVVTGDAGITSRYLTHILTDANASYCLAIKGNAGHVHNTIESMEWENAKTFKTEENLHGREEERTIQVLKLKSLETAGLFGDIIPNDPSGQLNEYEDSVFIARVTSSITNKNRTEINQRYFILGGKAFKTTKNEAIIAAGVIRAHWKIESNHWVKDVVLCEDDCPTKTPQSSQTLASLRDISLGVIRIFSKSPTIFIRELSNNIKDFWTDIASGALEEKSKCYS